MPNSTNVEVASDRISISFCAIVPVFNTPAHLLRPCLNSLVGQDYANLEIIIIDDGSNAECRALCDEFAYYDERVKVVHQENKGVSAARNLGISLANSDYVAFIDSDDRLESDLFNRLNQGLVDEKGADLILFRFDRIQPDGSVINSFDGRIALHPPDSFTAALRIASAQEHLNNMPGVLYQVPWGKAWKRSFLLANRVEFPENINFREDNIFALSALSHNPRTAIVDYKGYHWVMHSESATRRFKSARHVFPQTFSCVQETIRACYFGEQKDDLLKASVGLAQRLLDEGVAFSIAHPESGYSFVEATNALKDLYEGLGKPYDGVKIRNLGGVSKRIVIPFINGGQYGIATALLRLRTFARRQ